VSDDLIEGVVIASIAGQAYAFPIVSVREVVQVVEPTAMPNWPEHVLGLIEIRGELVPLLDVAETLGHEKTRVSVTQLVLVLALEGKTVGVLVDSVEGVRSGSVRRTEAFAQASGKGELARGIWTSGQGESGARRDEQPDRDSAESRLGTAVLVDPGALVQSLELP
jgi:chemotaxis signal transduction protein